MDTPSSSQASPARPSGRLATLLLANRERLLAEWTQRVCADPAVPEAQRLPEPALRDHLPGLIDQLADLLQRLGTTEHDYEEVERLLGGVAWEHGLHRLAEGYDVRAAVRELAHFRIVLMALWREAGVALDKREAELVHAALDAAMATSATAIARALSDHEQRLRIAMAAGDLGTWDWDLVTGAMRWDARTKELFGLPPDAEIVYESNFLAALHPEDRARVDEAVRATMEPASGGAYRIEYRAIGANDGVERWLTAQGRTLFDEHGTPVRMLGTLMDVTERRRDEEALTVLAQASAVLSSSLDYEATLRTVARLVVQHLADYCMVDLIDEAGQFRRVELSGRDPIQESLVREARPYPPSRAPGSPFTQVLTTRQPMLVEDVTPAWLDALADHPTYRAILAALGPRSAMLVPLVARDRPLGVLKIFSAEPGRRYKARDLTFAADLGRRAALAVDNAQLYRDARDALEVLHREAEFRERFVAILGHDLRAPLAAIDLSAATLLKEGSLGERQCKAVTRIAKASSRMERMVSDLLDLTRLRQSGGLPVAPQPTDLGAIVAQVVGEHATAHADRAIDLATEGDTRGTWDPDRIAQVVQNVVGNALDHSPPDALVRVAVRGAAEHVELEVYNGGPPIPPDVLPTLFDPFKRGTTSRSASKGLGLGLYIACEIVRAHGGEFHVVSTADAGTTFRVDLPRAPTGARA